MSKLLQEKEQSFWAGFTGVKKDDEQEEEEILMSRLLQDN